jgi:hypothetical protein
MTKISPFLHSSEALINTNESFALQLNENFHESYSVISMSITQFFNHTAHLMIPCITWSEKILLNFTSKFCHSAIPASASGFSNT